MKKNLLAVIFLAAGVAFAEEYFDDEDYDGSGCSAPYSTDYVGYLQDAAGKTELASIKVRETRGSRIGVSFLKMTIQPKKGSSFVLVCSKVKLPDRAILTEPEGRYRADAICNVALKGDSYSGVVYGTLNGGGYANCFFKAASSDVDINKPTGVNPNIDFRGYWGAVFLPANASGAGIKGLENGFLFAQIELTNKGTVQVTTYLPNGTKQTCKGAFETRGGRTVYPVVIKKSQNGSYMTFSFDVVWNNGYADQGLPLSSALSIQNVSPWQCGGTKAPFKVDMAYFDGGFPSWTKTQWKTAHAEIVHPQDWIVETPKLSYNDKTGLITGSAKATYPLSSGKTKRGTISFFGIIAHDEGWGFGLVKNVGTVWLKVNK